MIRYPDLFSWLKDREGGYVLNWDANDLLKLLDTWYYGDISLIRDNGDYVKALSSIKVKGLIMPSKTDLYFPVCLKLICTHDRALIVRSFAAGG